jgi:hypothetical protein
MVDLLQFGQGFALMAILIILQSMMSLRVDIVQVLISELPDDDEKNKIGEREVSSLASDKVTKARERKPAKQ